MGVERGHKIARAAAQLGFDTWKPEASERPRGAEVCRGRLSEIRRLSGFGGPVRGTASFSADSGRIAAAFDEDSGDGRLVPKQSSRGDDI